MTFQFNDHLIPLYKGHAVGPGWTSATQHIPHGVTWHWTALRSLKDCRGVLGGLATKASRVSSHYCVGQTFAEGTDRYVSLENRSWHAGIGQKIRWDGKASTNKTKGARACIGVETCNVGYERPGHPAGLDWIEAVNTDSRWIMKIEPWSDEQFKMMVVVGKEIVARWPHISWREHHGHHDICPGYKQDVAGFPFARLLREIYDDPSVPDIWSPFWMPKPRQRALIALGYNLGPTKDDGDFGNISSQALLDFQKDTESYKIPHWTTFTCDKIFNSLLNIGLDPIKVAETPLS